MITKNLFNPLFCTAFILLSIVSCGKYEDGPSISFRSKKQRVVNTWQNEYDSDEIFDFKNDGSCEVYYISDLPFKYNGTWDFSEDKSQITVTVSGNPGFGTISVQYIFNIIELRNEKLCMEEATFGNEYCFIPYE